MSHPGSSSCYQSGCREPGCRLAKKIAMSRYRAQRERRGGKITERGIVGGKLGVPAAAVRVEIDDLRKVMTRRDISRRAGLSSRTIYDLALDARDYVFPPTARAIHRLWVDYCAPLEPDGRRWPAAPIRVAVIGCYGSLKASPWRTDAARVVRNGDVSTVTAERWADRLGLLPYDLWPDWGTRMESAS